MDGWKTIDTIDYCSFFGGFRLIFKGYGYVACKPTTINTSSHLPQKLPPKISVPLALVESFGQRKSTKNNRSRWCGLGSGVQCIPKDPGLPKLRMEAWNLNTMRFGGDWTPLHHSLTMCTGCQWYGVFTFTFTPKITKFCRSTDHTFE